MERDRATRACLYSDYRVHCCDVPAMAAECTADRICPFSAGRRRNATDHGGNDAFCAGVNTQCFAIA